MLSAEVIAAEIKHQPMFAVMQLHVRCHTVTAMTPCGLCLQLVHPKVSHCAHRMAHNMTDGKI